MGTAVWGTRPKPPVSADTAPPPSDSPVWAMGPIFSASEIPQAEQPIPT